MKVALIGAGKMGLPMAQHLQDAGHALLVHDSSEPARKRAQDAGLRVAGVKVSAQGDIEIVTGDERVHDSPPQGGNEWDGI